MQYVTLSGLVETGRGWVSHTFPRDRATGSRKASVKRQALAALQWTIPPISWLPRYNVRNDLPYDLAGGVVLGVLFIPSGLAYASLLSVPLSVGLYSAAVYCLIYCVFGGVAALSMGPVAEVSLLLLGSGGAPAEDKPEERAAFFQGIALQTAILTFAMCLVRGGAIIRNSFARAVGDAYSAAAGIILITSQLKEALNVSIPTSIKLHDIVRSLVEAVIQNATVNSIYSALIFLALMAYLVIVKRIRWLPSWIPHQLIVLVVSILATWGLRLDERIHLKIVGQINATPPVVGIPSLDNFGQTFTSSFIVSLVSFLQMYSLASRLAPTVDANHELFVNGLCALGVAVTGGFPGSSSFSGCSVLGDVGVRSQLNALIAGIVVLCSALFLIRLGVFHDLPKVALAAIICASVLKLVNFSHAYWLLRIFPLDFVVWTTTFLVTLFFGVAPGILSGIGLSTVIVLFRVGRPPTSTLGYDPQRRQWRELDDDELLLNPHVLVWSFNAPLYFVNVSFFSTLLGEAITAAGRPLSVVVVNFSRVTSIDASSVQALTTQLRSVQQRHAVRVFLAAVHPIVEEALLRAPTETRIEWLVNDDAIFVSVDAAVAHAEAYVQHKRHLLAPHPQVPAAAFGLRSEAGGSQRSAASVLLGGTARREDRRLLGVIGVVSHADRTPKQKLKCTIDDGAVVKGIFAADQERVVESMRTGRITRTSPGSNGVGVSAKGNVIKPPRGSAAYAAVVDALRAAAAGNPSGTEASMVHLLTDRVDDNHDDAECNAVSPVMSPPPDAPLGASPGKSQAAEAESPHGNPLSSPGSDPQGSRGQSAFPLEVSVLGCSPDFPSDPRLAGSAMLHPPVLQVRRKVVGGPTGRVTAIVVVKWGGRQTATGRRQALHFGSTLATRIGLDQDRCRLHISAVSNGEDRVEDTGNVVVDALCAAMDIGRDTVPLVRDKSLDETSDAARVFVAECEHRVTQLFRPLPPAILRRKWHIPGVADLSIAHGIPTPYHAACLAATRIADLMVALGEPAAAALQLSNGETAALMQQRYGMVLAQFDPDAEVGDLLAADEDGTSAGGTGSHAPSRGAAAAGAATVPRGGGRHGDSGSASGRQVQFSFDAGGALPPVRARPASAMARIAPLLSGDNGATAVGNTATQRTTPPLGPARPPVTSTQLLSVADGLSAGASRFASRSEGPGSVSGAASNADCNDVASLGTAGSPLATALVAGRFPSNTPASLPIAGGQPDGPPSLDPGSDRVPPSAQPTPPANTITSAAAAAVATSRYGHALFADPRMHRFDTTKVTGLYDHVAFDVIHNARALAAVGIDIRPLFALAQALYVIVSGSRFGADPSEKFISGTLLAEAFLRRLRESIERIIECDKTGVCVGDDSECGSVAGSPVGSPVGHGPLCSTRLDFSPLPGGQQQLPVNLFFTSTGLVQALRNCLTHSASLNALLVDEGARQTLQRMELGGWHYMTHLVLKVFRVASPHAATATLAKHAAPVGGEGNSDAAAAPVPASDIVVEVYLSMGASLEAAAVAHLRPDGDVALAPGTAGPAERPEVDHTRAAAEREALLPDPKAVKNGTDNLLEVVHPAPAISCAEADGEARSTLTRGDSVALADLALNMTMQYTEGSKADFEAAAAAATAALVGSERTATRLRDGEPENPAAAVGHEDTLPVTNAASRTEPPSEPAGATLPSSLGAAEPAKAPPGASNPVNASHRPGRQGEGGEGARASVPPRKLSAHLVQAAKKLTRVQPMVRVWTLRLDSIDEFLREVEAEGRSQGHILVPPEPEPLGQPIPDPLESKAVEQAASQPMADPLSPVNSADEPQPRPCTVTVPTLGLAAREAPRVIHGTSDDPASIAVPEVGPPPTAHGASGAGANHSAAAVDGSAELPPPQADATAPVFTGHAK